MSLEDLMNVQVTTASKTEQKLSRVAAAVFVISQDDIKKSGATNIPDLLRMVPGIDVAQINANTWAISARGLNDRFSNELLVMVDGRTVYTPTFGGVLWDTLDLPLEDIERIEVIRGPGGSVWGANAVNGVINIITKKAADTPGVMVVAGGGNLDQGSGTTQYGGSVEGNTNYRIYTKYFNESQQADPAGQPGGDGWHMLRGGFRMDTALSSKDTLTVQGDLYTGEEGQTSPFLPSVTSPALIDVNTQFNLSGGYLQGIWNRVYSPRSDITLQISYDHYKRDDVLMETRDTLNIDFQHHFLWGDRQNVVWGLGYRYTTSTSDGTLAVSLNPADYKTQVFSSFIQDEIALAPERFYLTVGTKLEHNAYTGFNLMPSVRATWTPTTHHMFWAAISKADRTPAEIDTSIRLNFGGFTGSGGTPVLESLIGNPNFQNEEAIAYEMGYRATVSNRLSLDLTAYFNSYTHQETTEPVPEFLEPDPAPPHFVMAETYENLMNGEAHGIEAAAKWKVMDRWTISPGYAFEEIHMHLAPTSQDTTSIMDAEGTSPRHSAQLRSNVDLPHHWAWDTSAYFVDRLASGNVPSYTRLDSQLTWNWKKMLTVSLVGQNLLKDHHLEFVDDSGSVESTLEKRSAYVKIVWHPELKGKSK